MKKSNCPCKSIYAGPSDGQGGALAVVKRPVPSWFGFWFHHVGSVASRPIYEDQVLVI